jgi:hypothetical protein
MAFVKKWIQALNLSADEDTGALLTAAGGLTLLEAGLVTVDNTATGKTLATLGYTVPAATKLIRLQNIDTGVIYYLDGSVAANTGCPIPSGGSEDLPIDYTAALTLKFIASTATEILFVKCFG